MTAAITIENLGKCYQRQTDSADYATVRERMMKFLSKPFRRDRPSNARVLGVTRHQFRGAPW